MTPLSNIFHGSTKCTENLLLTEKMSTGPQGVPIENYLKQMAVELKQCIFDPMLVKPKCVWEAVDF